MTATASAASAIDRWIRLYTWILDPEVAAARREEVLGDVRDEIDWSRAQAISDATVARGLRRRALRGAPADLMWAVGRAWRTTSTFPAMEYSLRLLIAALALGLIAIGVVTLARRGFVEDPSASLVVLAGIVIAAGGVALLGARLTRAFGALWVTGSVQIILLDGIGQLAQTSTVLVHVVGTTGWQHGMVLADVGASLLCLAAAAWWATERPLPIGGGER